MIHYTKKDITTVDCGIIAHGVNCQRKMGSGVAKAIRAKWPLVYEAYVKSPTGATMLGTAHLINLDRGTDSLFVANCYTQVFYGYGGGKYADAGAVRQTLMKVVNWADFYDLPAYLPRIGCGLGGLDWALDVEPALNKISEDFPRVDIWVCDL